MRIREASPTDLPAVVEIFRPVVRAGETYALDRDLDDTALLAYWSDPGKRVFVGELDGAIAGAAYLRRNQGGGGGHVANAGFVTAARFGGRGVAHALGVHVLEAAAAAGFRAMQFNFVVSTNLRAVALWERLGFAIVGRLPAAFAHPVHGAVDALVMHRPLAATPCPVTGATGGPERHR